uniref:V-type proton ATPase subunit a n=1 Tax=Syphacia muris TaxID=451379 RepID=A0A0N5AQS7_9BILA
MGSLLRSETMCLAQIFLQTESAYACVAELGELGLAQFRDLNAEISAYQRKFVTEVKRCDEMERKLRELTTFTKILIYYYIVTDYCFIEGEIAKDEIEIPDVNEHIPAPLPKDMNDLEAKFERLEEELLKVNENTNSLKKDYNNLIELNEVLRHVQQFLDEGQRERAKAQIAEAQQAQLDAESYSGSNKLRAVSFVDDFMVQKLDNEMKYIAGVLPKKKAISFERTLWRACRGNAFVRTSDITGIDESLQDEPESKVVFIIFYYGDQLGNKCTKICDGYRASLYNCPGTAEERGQMRHDVEIRIEELHAILRQTMEHREKVLRATALNYKTWTIKVLKIKSIFHTLNMFSLDITQKCLIAECWIPVTDIPLVRHQLQVGAEISGSSIPPVLNKMEFTDEPPTFHRTNKFTRGFQNIVDSYGIATYREINPAPWTIISFPFIFAVMFGDAGHGIIMFLAALALVLFENRLIAMKIRDEIFNTFFGGRYVILLMGIFSIYTGLVYNDIYSKSINIFGSGWKNPYRLGPYPFGVDPIWNIATNKLNFLNPLKMKMSVIIGIAQMTFGLMLSLGNYIYFRSVVDVVFIFIPELVFLACIFIYLCVQIIIKWLMFWVEAKEIFGWYYPSSHCAPSLLIGLINMFMMKSREEGYVQKNDTSTELDQCYLQQWYPHQSLVEMILLVLAVVSIPVMLLVKPIILKIRASRGQPVKTHGGGESEEFSFGDTMVYQAIHTIEFCLGCISHTASYLRLWALSLAHAQLSEVLWSMVFNIAFTMGGWAGVAGQYIIFWVFAILSISILILMEGLSAFLHALRLHWVEFQSKFYGGTGYQFEPFSFEAILRVAEGLDN